MCTKANISTEKVVERNRAYYEKFPGDAERVKKIMGYLTANKVALPSGWLTPARFQQLGIVFGFHGKTIPSQYNEKALLLTSNLGGIDILHGK